MEKKKIDPVCLIHGKKMSEHFCLYCCLCFKSLTPEECNVREDGQKEDEEYRCSRNPPGSLHGSIKDISGNRRKKEISFSFDMACVIWYDYIGGEKHDNSHCHRGKE